MITVQLQCEVCHKYYPTEQIENCEDCNKLICPNCNQLDCCPECIKKEIDDIGSGFGLIVN